MASVTFLATTFAIFTAVISTENTGHVSSFRITLHVFSGTPDPQWTIPQTDKQFPDILHGVVGHKSTPLGSKLGYNGFTIDTFNNGDFSRSMDVGRCTRTDFEMVLLDVVKDRIPEGYTELLGTQVIDYVRSQIQACSK